jgi:LacI family transcriptional regulator
MQGKRNGTTLSQVAEKAGVSVSTVSRVLNNFRYVSPETRKTVEWAMQEMNYQPVRLRTQGVEKGKYIALYVLDIQNPFYPSLVDGVMEVANMHGYNLILCDTRHDDESHQHRMKRLIERKSVEGIIYIPLRDLNPFVEELVDGGFPIVFADNKIDRDNVSYVTSDNYEGAYQAARYLISLGHRKIVFIKGSDEYSTETQRLQGFNKALAESNIKMDDRFYVDGQYDLKKSYLAVKSLLDASVDFTAIFAANDFMAFGAKQALDEYHLKVPDDVSLMGFDDIPLSAAISLTTVAQPSNDMGRNAMILLLDYIHGRLKRPKHILLKPSIVIRNSCKSLSQG